ncbi:MAG TPA: phosphoribosylformylglycinamidine synthase subunit PurS, partial [Hyphomicrobiales bacterium]|nr:phosphoribosylformylglycinamidine synthase subunit PurS [Hyphomicrobiales bacterium]
VELAETDPERAKATLERMCKELLANPVIENYRYELEGA